MKLLLTILLFITTSLVAKTYNNVSFTGLVHLSPLTASELINIELGIDTSEKKLNEALLKLFNQGYFQDIKVIEEGDTLKFICIEKPVVSRIKFKGVSESEVEEKYSPLVGIKKGEVYNPLKVRLAKEKIIEMMQAQGLFDTVVESEIEVDGIEKVDIIFNISKGKSIIITKLDIDGLKAFDMSAVEKDIANREEDMFGWFFGQNDGKLKLADLVYDDQRMKNYYLKHGYLDANVSKAKLEVDFKQYSARLHYKVQEGDPYILNGINIEVIDNNISLSHLHEDFRLKIGRNFNVELMRKDVSKIEDAVGTKGYAFARVFPDVVQDKENNTAVVDFKVNTGKKVYINDVIISGNDRTLDRVIRREIFLAPGDLFNSVELRESKSALGRLGFFEATDIATVRVSDDKINLMVKVKETHTASLSAGGGYGSLNGVTFNASITDRNVFGSGKNLSLQVERSEFSNSVAVSLFNPRVNDSTYSLGFSVNRSETDYTSFNAFGYKSRSNSVSLRSGKRLGRYWHTSLSFAYTSSFVNYETIFSANSGSLHDRTASDILNYQFLRAVESRALTLSHYIGFDNTDDFFTPRRGIKFSNSLSTTGFGEIEEYTKDTMQIAAFYGIRDTTDIDLVFRVKSRLAYLWGDINNGTTLPLLSRYRLGGIGSVRGFQTSSVAPVAFNGLTNDPIYRSDIGRNYYLGGNYYATTNLELNFPIIADAKLRGTLFYDYGVIGLDGFDLMGITTENVERKSVGIAFEWQTPMAPLQFVFAQPLNQEEYDEEQSFEFTIGQQF
jgi:outer membrane protein insertion porin family